MRKRGAGTSSPDPQAIQSGAVGQRLGDAFKLASVPALVTNHLHVSRMAVTVIKSDDPVLGLTASVATEDAYLVGLLLRTAHDHQVWEDGRPFPKRTMEAGQFLLRDLNRAQAALIDRPHHSMHFYLPRAALDEIADDLEAPRIGELRHLPAIPFSDPIVAALGASLVPVFERPREANRMFVEYVTFALGAHVAQAYGDMRPRVRRPKGGLAAWQERRAKEVLSAGVGQEVSLGEVAKLCGLSTSHFSRAFKDTTGIAPYQWLVLRRVEAAKSLLSGRPIPLSDIALECGFADQSHFTRVFSRVTGLSPGAWRRGVEIEIATPVEE